MSRSSPHAHPARRRHPWWGVLIITALMLLGGVLGLIVSGAWVASEEDGFWQVLTSTFSGAFVSPLLGFFAGLAVVGGVMLGGWLGIALVTRLRPGLPCPRCGTDNRTDASVCWACDLPLR